MSLALRPLLQVVAVTIGSTVVAYTLFRLPRKPGEIEVVLLVLTWLASPFALAHFANKGLTERATMLLVLPVVAIVTYLLNASLLGIGY